MNILPYNLTSVETRACFSLVQPETFCLPLSLLVSEFPAKPPVFGEPIIRNRTGVKPALKAFLPLRYSLPFFRASRQLVGASRFVLVVSQAASAFPHGQPLWLVEYNLTRKRLFVKRQCYHDAKHRGLYYLRFATLTGARFTNADQ